MSKCLENLRSKNEHTSTPKREAEMESLIVEVPIGASGYLAPTIRLQ